MAGLYIHIPFCSTRCIYCDFYSTTQNDQQEAYVQALCRELEMRRDYLQGEPIETIYFGGGTPSQLTATHFEPIFVAIEQIFGLAQCREVTLEANPDDLTPEYLQHLSHLPFNRISMGIQTFNDKMLKFLKRRHTAAQAKQAVAACRAAGFSNISIDLMYGLPGETLEQWRADLEQALALEVEHISAYHLIYEEQTPLYTLQQNHRVTAVDEESSIQLFTHLIDTLTEAGYLHYEISNFCRPEKFSQHNTAYWQGVPYLGCGPSAHSFDGDSRRWNSASLVEYIAGIESGKPAFEREERDEATRYNELVLTSLRTHWGLSLDQVKREFGEERYTYCLRMAAKHLKRGVLEEQEQRLRLTRAGIFLSDGIMSDLLWV